MNVLSVSSQDYPSIGLVRRILEENGVTVIFAVTQNVGILYQVMYRNWNRSLVIALQSCKAGMYHDVKSTSRRVCNLCIPLMSSRNVAFQASCLKIELLCFLLKVCGVLWWNGCVQ